MSIERLRDVCESLQVLADMSEAEVVWSICPGSTRTKAEREIENRVAHVRSDVELKGMLDEVRALRGRILESHATEGSPENGLKGRFLMVDLDRVVEDGHANVDSSLHISRMHTPRPILWLAAVNLILLSWVPNEIVEDIEIAITCNAEESFQWL